MISLAVVPCGVKLGNEPMWYRLQLTVGDVSTHFSYESIAKEDIIRQGEQLVSEFSKQGISVVHNELYE